MVERGSLENSESSNPDSSPPTSTPKERDLTTLHRSKRLQALHQLHYVRRFEQEYPDEISLLRYCFQTEVEHPESGMNPADFLPTPEGWRQILRLPDRIKKAWLRALHSELILLIIDKKCFKPSLPGADDPIIPVTAKFRSKIKSDGTIDKLKARVCMRGDLQAELVDFDTWCPMAGYRELKIFVAHAVLKKCRIYQIDFVGAFLHAASRNKTYTVLPEDWKELFPDLEEWFGVPLLLLKSVYGVAD